MTSGSLFSSELSVWFILTKVTFCVTSDTVCKLLYTCEVFLFIVYLYNYLYGVEMIIRDIHNFLLQISLTCQCVFGLAKLQQQLSIDCLQFFNFQNELCNKQVNNFFFFECNHHKKVHDFIHFFKAGLRGGRLDAKTKLFYLCIIILPLTQRINILF